MNCYLCHTEAVQRCFTCGRLICEDHGKSSCLRCETGIAAGDRRTDRVSAELFETSSKLAWWRPQEAEDYEPPACHECQALARFVCRECGLRYCAEHAAGSSLCKLCFRVARQGNWLLAGVFSFMALILAWAWLYAKP